MKTLEDIIREVAEPLGKDEKDFKDKHKISKIGHPVAKETQFTADTKKKKRNADYEKGEDEKVHEGCDERRFHQAITKEGKVKHDMRFKRYDNIKKKEDVSEAKVTDDHWVLLKTNGSIPTQKSEIIKINKPSKKGPNPKQKLSGMKGTESLLKQLGEGKKESYPKNKKPFGSKDGPIKWGSKPPKDAKDDDMPDWMKKQGWHVKYDKYIDRYGNVVKPENVAKHLAKKGLRQAMRKESAELAKKKSNTFSVTMQNGEVQTLTAPDKKQLRMRFFKQKNVKKVVDNRNGKTVYIKESLDEGGLDNMFGGNPVKKLDKITSGLNKKNSDGYTLTLKKGGAIPIKLGKVNTLERGKGVLFFDNEKEVLAFAKKRALTTKKVTNNKTGKVIFGESILWEEKGVIGDLENIVKKHQASKIKFQDNNSLTVDVQTANMLTKVYKALNPANKAKFEKSLSKNETSFMKMLDFAWSNIK
jgi:hypothetical protein